MTERRRSEVPYTSLGFRSGAPVAKPRRRTRTVAAAPHQPKMTGEYGEGFRDGVAASVMSKDHVGRYHDRLHSEIPKGAYKRGYDAGWKMVAGSYLNDQAREAFDR